MSPAIQNNDCQSSSADEESDDDRKTEDINSCSNGKVNWKNLNITFLLHFIGYHHCVTDIINCDRPDDQTNDQPHYEPDEVSGISTPLPPSFSDLSDNPGIANETLLN